MNEWILISKPESFNTDEVLREERAVEWYQNRLMKNMEVGDIAYIYICSPVKEIHWKCQVSDVHRMLPSITDDGIEIEEPYVALEVICEFRTEKLSYAELKRHGLKSVQGPHRINVILADYLHEIDQFENSEELQIQDAESLSITDLEKVAKKHAGTPVIREGTVRRHYVRDSYISEYAKRRANGKCQLCGQNAPFNDKKGNPYLESHHIVWLSKGGMDSIENTVALCPNCHRKMHVLSKAEDILFLQSLTH